MKYLLGNIFLTNFKSCSTRVRHRTWRKFCFLSLDAGSTEQHCLVIRQHPEFVIMVALLAAPSNTKLTIVMESPRNCNSCLTILPYRLLSNRPFSIQLALYTVDLISSPLKPWLLSLNVFCPLAVTSAELLLFLHNLRIPYYFLEILSYTSSSRIFISSITKDPYNISFLFVGSSASIWRDMRAYRLKIQANNHTPDTTYELLIDMVIIY